jgi:hypothetical protein
MAEPPVLVGAVQETGSWLSWLEVTVTDVGAPGVVAGVPFTAGEDAGPVPRSFAAVTVTA